LVRVASVWYFFILPGIVTIISCFMHGPTVQDWQTLCAAFFISDIFDKIICEVF
jgi:hypothetical protein